MDALAGVKALALVQVEPPYAGVVCPGCGSSASMKPLEARRPHGHIEFKGMTLGWYRCPAPKCCQLVLVLFRGMEIAQVYPRRVVDCNVEGVPETVVKSLREALDCQADGYFVASALLLRRSVEMLCAAHGVKGESLAARLKSLAETVVLPSEFVRGLDAIRLLGNDAAHVEARHYDQVGAEEVGAAVVVIQTVINALYHRGSQLAALQVLRREQATAPALASGDA